MRLKSSRPKAKRPRPRSDGLVWLPGDFQSDFTHPNTSARQKVGAMLLSFMKSSPQASCWFLAGRVC